MKTKLVTLKVKENVLKQWDDLANSIGISRTGMLHNAVKIYGLFISNQLNGSSKENIKEQLEQIKVLLKGIDSRTNILNNKKTEIEDTIEDLDLSQVQDFEIVSEKIITLLQNWGSLPSDTISIHLSYPGWIVWTVLKKLKANKKVKLENGEWKLLNESRL